MYANGNLELMLNTMLFNEDGGMVSKLSDSGNVGILVFLVMLGILVSLLIKREVPLHLESGHLSTSKQGLGHRLAL